MTHQSDNRTASLCLLSLLSHFPLPAFLCGGLPPASVRPLASLLPTPAAPLWPLTEPSAVGDIHDGDFMRSVLASVHLGLVLCCVSLLLWLPWRWRTGPLSNRIVLLIYQTAKAGPSKWETTTSSTLALTLALTTTLTSAQACTEAHQ